MSKDVVAFVIGIHEVKKGTGWWVMEFEKGTGRVETVRLSKKEQVKWKGLSKNSEQVITCIKVGHNKDIIRI